MDAQETNTFVAETILWVRMGGYSTVIIFILSIAITILAFIKKSQIFAYTFLVVSMIFFGYFLLFNHGYPLIAVQLAQIGKILPYILILWVLIKLKKQ